MAQNIDPFTKRKLIPIQGWVEIPTHKALEKKAKKARTTLKAFIRNKLEEIAES